jgi:diguanylate cyclase (GGDEF)-like protein
MPTALNSAAEPAHASILIIDDQKVTRAILETIFAEDFVVHTAFDGEEGLVKAQALQPDLILSDVVMPGIDGFEVCRRLKCDPKTANIPVVFITGRFDEEDEVQGFAVGGADFIHKPINQVITRARVQNHLAAKLAADKLREVASVDGLTGIANRRKFDETAVNLYGHCRREQQPLSLVMIDVDCFKLYNDCYGHQAGDACLQLVAARLSSGLRRSLDLAARYGGEEFGCIVPNAPAAKAAELAEQLRVAVEALKIEHQESTVAEVVTVSIGVASLVPDGTVSIPDFLEYADRQLYLAKRNGRNQVAAIDLTEKGGQRIRNV